MLVEAYGEAAVGGAGGAGAGGGGDNIVANFGGVDPNMYPNLAIALRVSMEEESARQECVASMAVTNNEEKKMGDDADTAASANNEGGAMELAAPAADLHG